MGSLNNQLKVIIYILLVNAFVALLYLLWNMYQKDYKKGAMMTIMMLVAPVVGPLYLGASALMYEVYFKRRKEILNIEELSFRKDKIELIARDDMESALNKVPIEEALLVSGVQSTRRLILNVLKDDTENYVHSINQATSNQDSEVSHYAATAITDIMNKFKQKEKILKENYEEDPTNEVAAEMYWNHIGEFLQTDVLPRVEQERYLTILEDFTLRFEEEFECFVTGQMYYLLTLLSMEVKKPAHAQMWVDKALTKRADDIYSYKAGLKYYYDSHKVENYKNLLKELMESDIRLDRETLELVRFYKQ